MILTIVALCVVAAVAVLFLKQHRPEFALLLSTAAGIIALIYMLSPVFQIIESLKNQLESVGLSEVFKVILKVIGICYLTDFSADLCRDFGQSSLAGKVETAGKIAIVALCLPLVDSVLKITQRLIG